MLGRHVSKLLKVYCAILQEGTYRYSISYQCPPLHFQFFWLPLTTDYHDPTVQSRVRRLIGRRRAGLDRYVGVLSREAGQSHDNIDPITDLLSQLSGELQDHIDYLISG